MSAATDAGRLSGRPLVRPTRTALALGAWGLSIVACGVWGRFLIDGGHRIFLGAPPLFGTWDLRLTPGVAVAVGVGAALVVAGPGLARRLSWHALLAASFAGALAWPLALALTAGATSITSPLESPHEYLTIVPLIHSPGDFVATFIDRIDTFSTHVSSHPPGMALILYGLDRVGLGGSGPAAGLIVGVGASAPAAALIAARALAGEVTARRAAPFLVVAPTAVWIATSADALYMGVAAWAVALIVVAMTKAGRRSDALALAGGLLFGIASFLSFGVVLLGTIPLVVAISERRVRAPAIALAGAGAVALAFLAGGYWWLDGYAAARGQYLAGVAPSRPYGYFIFNNLAALALATGPALAVALVRLRDRRLWLLVGGAIATIAIADLSGMSKAEVERIWLPFTPWLLLATAALSGRLRDQRRLLAGQAACALLIEMVVATPW